MKVQTGVGAGVAAGAAAAAVREQSLCAVAVAEQVLELTCAWAYLFESLGCSRCKDSAGAGSSSGAAVAAAVGARSQDSVEQVEEQVLLLWLRLVW